MYQALYRKYRPKTLDDVYGQDVIVKILKNAITNDKISHAFLFAGPRGTGKTSVAKIFATMVNCEKLKNNKPCGKCVSCSQTNNSDIIEIDAASNNGVDEIRELKNKVTLVPAYGKYKVYIIDEVHMLTTGAFNALLKTLEEPPKHVIFILATTDPQRIPDTILSRCQRFDFKKISENNITKRLKEIAEKENINISDDALFEIATLSDGGMRDSISMLDQAVSYGGEKIEIEDIHSINGTLTFKSLEELVLLIKKQKIDKLFKKIDAFNDEGKNFVKLTEEIISYLRNLLILKQAPEYFDSKYGSKDYYKKAETELSNKEILHYIDTFNDNLMRMKNSNTPKLLLELSLIKIMNFNDAITEKKGNIKEIDISKKVVTSKIEPNKEKVAAKIDNDKMVELKNLRINNTLAQFKKRKVLDLNKKIDGLNNLLLDPDYSKYASIILDGTLKAASDEYLIFVYPNERISELFNQNILEIEKTITKVFENAYKVISTDINDWETIKNDFNSKKKTYSYIEDNIKIEDILKDDAKSEFSIFEDIIEYK